MRTSSSHLQNRTGAMSLIRAAFVFASMTGLILLDVASATTASARTVVWARSSDALTLDPHAANEGPTHTLNHQIYEPLVIRDTRGKVRPALAIRWHVTDDPRIWVFELRPGVTFHDGTPLRAEDVVFSIERARHPASDLKARLNRIEAVRKRGENLIEIQTRGRDPLLPIQLTDIFIMSEAWAAKHDVRAPQNHRNQDATAYTALHANGTGPFILKSRQVGAETHLTRNANYWETLPPINEIIYRIIPDNEARLAALLDGKADFIQDVPIGKLDILRANPAITLKSGPENRVIFLGLNVTPTLRTAPANTDAAPRPNPLADRRVRMALDIALDRSAIQRDVMKGQSIPTGVVAPPTINGFPQRLDRIAPPDREQAKALLKEAGHATGFPITLDCPNDRYVNDAEICKAVAAQLATIGVKLDVVLRSKRNHFPLVRNRKSDMYLLGWGVPTFDSEYVFRHLFHSAPPGEPAWNGTGFKDAKIDNQIESLASETNFTKRNQTISEVWWRAHAERIYIPIHVQTLTYAMRKGLDIDVDISDTPKLKFARITADGTPQPVTGN